MAVMDDDGISTHAKRDGMTIVSRWQGSFDESLCDDDHDQQEQLPVDSKTDGSKEGSKKSSSGAARKLKNLLRSGDRRAESAGNSPQVRQRTASELRLSRSPSNISQGRLGVSPDEQPAGGKLSKSQSLEAERFSALMLGVGKKFGSRQPSAEKVAGSSTATTSSPSKRVSVPSIFVSATEKSLQPAAVAAAPQTGTGTYLSSRNISSPRGSAPGADRHTTAITRVSSGEDSGRFSKESSSPRPVVLTKSPVAVPQPPPGCPKTDANSNRVTANDKGHNESNNLKPSPVQTPPSPGTPQRRVTSPLFRVVNKGPSAASSPDSPGPGVMSPPSSNRSPNAMVGEPTPDSSTVSAMRKRFSVDDEREQRRQRRFRRRSDCETFGTATAQNGMGAPAATAMRDSKVTSTSTQQLTTSPTKNRFDSALRYPYKSDAKEKSSLPEGPSAYVSTYGSSRPVYGSSGPPASNGLISATNHSPYAPTPPSYASKSRLLPSRYAFVFFFFISFFAFFILCSCRFVIILFFYHGCYCRRNERRGTGR